MIECETMTTTTLHRIADLYGISEQLHQTQEELAELIVSLHKYERSGTAKAKVEWRDNVISEMADVTIMLAQMTHLLDCQEELEVEIDRKIERQVERMKEAGIWQ